MMKTTTFLLLFALTGWLSANLSAQCCNYNLLMRDSYGDGWDGATLEVFINNNSVGVFSAANSGSNAIFSVCNGDSLRLVYTAGSYENENSYELRDNAWNVLFQDGNTPNTGNVFANRSVCNTTSPQGNHPCTAIPIDTTQCIFTNNVGFGNSGLIPNCGNFAGGDMWFSMQVPASGNLSFETDSGDIDDTGLAIWGGSSCANSNLLGCDDDGGQGYYSYLTLDELVAGQTVYIQVWKYGGGTGSFRICVKDLGRIVLDSSDLPIVMINTLNQTIVPDTKINATMQIKYNGAGNLTYLNDNPNVYNGNIGISVRGASSSGYPQRPYSVETRTANGGNNNVSILGMPAENDWVLLSHYNDRSLLKNLMSYKLFGEMGNYAPRARLCEVLIDSAYRGIYLFGEKIKRDNNRVDIANLSPMDTVGDELTGGYILQQNYWDNNNSFQSNYSPIDHPTLDVHFIYEYPDAAVIAPAQRRYIADYVDSLETALYSPNFADPVLGYRKYLDVKSFIDYFLLNEVARNMDGFKKSVFFHKDKNSNGGLLKAGPSWDFDWAWKDINECSLYANNIGAGWAHKVNDCNPDNNSTGWYVRLLQDSSFTEELKCTYDNYRQSILDTTYLFAYIDSMRNVVQTAQDRHFRKWALLGRSGPAPDLGAVATTYNGELDSLKRWIATRLTWLDANMFGLCTPTAIDEVETNTPFVCYPNPATTFINADCVNGYQIYNTTGQLLQQSPISTQNIDVSNLPAGLYILKTGLKTAKFVKIE